MARPTKPDRKMLIILLLWGRMLGGGKDAELWEAGPKDLCAAPPYDKLELQSYPACCAYISVHPCKLNSRKLIACFPIEGNNTKNKIGPH